MHKVVEGAVSVKDYTDYKDNLCEFFCLKNLSSILEYNNTQKCFLSRNSILLKKFSLIESL